MPSTAAVSCTHTAFPRPRRLTVVPSLLSLLQTKFNGYAAGNGTRAQLEASIAALKVSSDVADTLRTTCRM
jgi:hypothetical protein